MEWKGRIIMAATKRRYDKEEFARRGDAIYEQEVRPQPASRIITPSRGNRSLALARFMTCITILAAAHAVIEACRELQ
jgi:hypothetical protein